MKKILRIAGYTSIVGSFFYLFIVLVLGLVQPGYNHFVDTMSVLALGQWGWVQNINFIILAITLSAVGLGLSITLEKKLLSFISFLFFTLSIAAISLIFAPADPVDRTRVQLTTLNSFQGFVHITTTMIIIGLTIPLVLFLMKKMRKNARFTHLVRYTFAVFVINIVGGTLWFICRRYGVLFMWKGLWQKALAVNVLVWMMVVGNQFLVQSDAYARRTH